MESKFVTENLHNWIDLIFGYKSRGEYAIKYLNNFPKISYAENLDSISFEDELSKKAFLI